MKKVTEIFLHDIKIIFTNYSALIIVLALCILPSLYAWFNIKASWDPYSKEATSGILVGVVNEDKGVPFGSETKNFGNLVVTELKENNQLGWRLSNKREAYKALENGTFYATITIPKDFSKKLMSITTENPQQGRLLYTVNEKINAIAPKLTDKGATGIQSKIEKEVTKTISGILLEYSKELGINLESQLPKLTAIGQKLAVLRNNFPKIEEKSEEAFLAAHKISTYLEKVNKALPTVEKRIKSMKSYSTSLEDYVMKMNLSTDQILQTSKKQVQTVSYLSHSISKTTESLGDILTKDNLDTGLEGIYTLEQDLRTEKSILNTIRTGLESLNQLSENHPLDYPISQLQEKTNKIDTVVSLLETIQVKYGEHDSFDIESWNSLKKVLSEIDDTVQDLAKNFDSLIADNVTSILSKITTSVQNTSALLSAAAKKLPTIETYATLALNSLYKGESELAALSKSLPTIEKEMNLLVDKLQKAGAENGIQELITLLKANISEQVNYLEEPLIIQEEKLFPMKNYGTGMTPFYSVLSLWVGLLLITSVLSVDTNLEASYTQNYIGKLLLFISIAVIQALIVSLGDLYLLKIYCKHQVFFVLNNLIVGLTFAVIIYSLVSVLGNIGKVIGIILLVLQIGGSGGTFPIQLTPPFFQKINPFLPFTYAISLNREAIGGAVYEVVRYDYIRLSIFLILSLIIAICLKKPINQLLEPFTKKFHDSQLGV